MSLLAEPHNGQFTGCGWCTYIDHTVNESINGVCSISRPSQKGIMGPNGCNTTATYDEDAIEVRVGDATAN